MIADDGDRLCVEPVVVQTDQPASLWRGAECKEEITGDADEWHSFRFGANEDECIA